MRTKKWGEPWTEKESVALDAQIAVQKAEQKAELLLEMLVDARETVNLAVAKEHLAISEVEKEQNLKG